jgi:hypothetical protein
VKLLHGKGRYQKRKLDLQHVSDIRWRLTCRTGRG